jgi:hypothetical protein
MSAAHEALDDGCAQFGGGSQPAPLPNIVREFLSIISEQAQRALKDVADPGLLQVSRLHSTSEDLVPSRYAIADVDRMAKDAIADSEAGHNVYIEGRTVRADLRGKKRGTLDDTALVFAFVIDSDADKGMGWTETTKASLIVETSPGNAHYWFFLDKALGAKEAQELGDRIRAAAGADHDTGNVVQPYRIAGTVNYPSPKN